MVEADLRPGLAVGHGDQTSVDSILPATASSARSKIGGRSLPRFPARRRITEQAFAVKKNRRGTSPVSKISDNEHTTPPLWDSIWEAACSDVLSVKNPVCDPIPEFAQHPEEGSKIPSSVRRQDAGDVLPDQPAGPIPRCNSAKGEHEVSPRVSQPFSQPRNAEGLTWGSTAKDIDICIRPLLEFRHVAPILDVRVMVGEDSAGEWLNLAEGDRLPAQRMPRLRCRLDARANRQVAQWPAHDTTPRNGARFGMPQSARRADTSLIDFTTATR